MSTTQQNIKASSGRAPLPPLFRQPYFLIAGAVVLVLLIIGVAFFIVQSNKTADKNPIVIALVGGVTGPQATQFKQIRQTLDLKVNEVNQKGGLDGHPLKLEIYDDQSNAELAVAQAKKIAESQAVLVLGHQISRTSLPASAVYKEAGVPILTGTSTTEEITLDNPYFFRTVSVNGDESKAIAAFSQNILKINTATIVYDDTVFGTSVRDKLKADFNNHIKNTYLIETDPQKQDADAEQIAKALAADPDPGIVCLATIDTNAFPVLLAAKRLGVKTTFFGTDFLGSDEFTKDFKQYAIQKGYPNVDNDGLYALAPLLFDSSRLTTQNLAAQYLKTYGQTMDWTGERFYEALLAGIEAIERAKIQNTPESLKQDRQKIRDALAAMDSPLNGTPGLEGSIFFNKTNDGTQPWKVGYFTGGKFISAPVQLQVINNLALLNVDEELKAGHVIKLGDQYVWIQRVVYAGMDVNQISRIDISKSTFTADVYFWLRYYGDDTPTQIEFPDAPDFNTGLKTPVASQVINGLNYRLYRLRGDVKDNFDLHNYPFDKQTLNIRFRNSQLNSEQLVYAIDTFGLKLPRATQSATTKALETLQTWRFSDLQYAQESYDSTSTRGDPRLFNVDSTIEFSGVDTVISVSRRYEVFLIKTLLPLALLTIVLYASLYFPASLLKEQVTVPVTGLLTGAVLLNAINSQLTDVGYTVAIEYLFYIYFVICLSCIVVAMLADRMDASKRQKVAQRIRVGFRILYPVMIIGIVAFYWVSYIS